jgi:FMN phosphatase YigB (HAD superfamily)
MVYWIFDLDYTLYSLPKNIPFDYKYLKTDIVLKKLINALPGEKGIFTNGTREHAYNSVIKMGLENVFNFIDGRDSLEGLKPEPNIFIKFMRKNNISINDKVLFFEDTLPNLEVAKRLGWITIYIQGDSSSNLLRRPKSVDFIFSNIKEALYFFHNHMNS